MSTSSSSPCASDKMGTRSEANSAAGDWNLHREPLKKILIPHHTHWYFKQQCVSNLAATVWRGPFHFLSTNAALGGSGDSPLCFSETKNSVGTLAKKNRTNSQGHPPPLHVTHLLCPTLHTHTHTHKHTHTNHACIKAHWNAGMLCPRYNSVSTHTQIYKKYIIFKCSETLRHPWWSSFSRCWIPRHTLTVALRRSWWWWWHDNIVTYIYILLIISMQVAIFFDVNVWKVLSHVTSV